VTATSVVYTGRAVRPRLRPQRLRQGFCARLGIRLADVIDGGHRTYENFARRKRRDDANPHFPIKAQRRDDRFDGAAHAAGKTVAKLCAGFFGCDG